MTGASSGIGAAALGHCMRRSTVYAAARRVDRMERSPALVSARGRRRPDDAAMCRSRHVVREAAARRARNTQATARTARRGRALAEGRRQFDVTVGAARRHSSWCRTCAPRQRTDRERVVDRREDLRADGQLLSRQQFALEGMSDSCGLELAPFGIEVVVIEPGSSRRNGARSPPRACSRSRGVGPTRSRPRGGELLRAMPRRGGHRHRGIAATIATAVRSRHPRCATSLAAARHRSCWRVGCFPIGLSTSAPILVPAGGLDAGSRGAPRTSHCVRLPCQRWETRRCAASRPGPPPSAH